MATVNYTNPIEDVHGKLAKHDKVIFRTRNGIRHAYVVKNPYEGKPSDKQTAARSSFRDLTQRVKAIYADPAQLALWQQRFNDLISSRAYQKQLRQYLAQQRTPSPIPYIPQPKVPKPPTTLYGFILSSLARGNQS